ncbi:hypothetical protein Tco_0848988 [Tanacetum coccineum]
MADLKPSWEHDQQRLAIIVGKHEAVPIDQPPENMVDSKHSSHREEYVIHLGVWPQDKSTHAMGMLLSKDDSTFLTISDDDEGPPICLNENANALPPIHFCITPLAMEKSIWTTSQCKDDNGRSDKNPAVMYSMRGMIPCPGKFNEHKGNLERSFAGRLNFCQNGLAIRVDVVSKVVPYVGMKLMNNDDIGRLVAKLVSASILYGWYQAFKEVAKIKEPFDITKVKGYRSSYKKASSMEATSLSLPSFLLSFELCSLLMGATLLVDGGLASTHFVECSTAIVRNFKFPRVVGKVPKMLIPQWLNGHVLPLLITSLLGTFLSVEYS